MSFHCGPKIVTDGLAFSVDAGDATSYPGSGTTWYDLSKTGYDGTIDGATFSTDGGGSVRRSSSSRINSSNRVSGSGGSGSCNGSGCSSNGSAGSSVQGCQ